MSSNLRLPLGVLGLVVLVIGTYFMLREPALGFEPLPDGGTIANVLSVVLTIFALLLGILFGSLHRIWRERRDPMSLGILRQSLSDPELWRSLLLAPLIFAGVYAASRSQPDWVIGFFFAFQSGFFSDVIRQGKLQPQPPVAPPT